MQQFTVCLSLALALLCINPRVAFGATLSFSTHSQSCDFCDGPPTPVHADLNNDGREDILGIVGGNVANGAFTVQLSNGDGTYAKSVLYQVPQNPGAGVYQIVAGDFNHDGKADVAAFSTDGRVYLFLNTGSGALSLSTTSFAYDGSTQSQAPIAIVADFNHDSLSDLAFFQYGQLHVWFGNGHGGFTTGPTTPFSTSPSQALLLGDFDGDGAADLAWRDSVSGAAVVAYGNNTGHFLKVINIALPAGASLYAADVNSDGKMDLTAHQFATRLNVYYGNAARTFANRTTVPFSKCLTSFAGAADMDGNGINDLIVGEAPCDFPYGPTSIAVRTRNPNASYNAEQTLYTAPVNNGNSWPALNPFVLRADRNAKPDLQVQQCTLVHCYAYDLVNLVNTTAGGFPSCAPANAFEGINVCSPAAGTPVASPVHFAVGASGPVTQRKVEVWADGKKLGEQLDGFSNYSFLNRSFSFTPGPHAITIFAAGWDNSLQKKSFTLDVQ